MFTAEARLATARPFAVSRPQGALANLVSSLASPPSHIISVAQGLHLLRKASPNIDFRSFCRALEEHFQGEAKLVSRLRVLARDITRAARLRANGPEGLASLQRDAEVIGEGFLLAAAAARQHLEDWEALATLVPEVVVQEQREQRRSDNDGSDGFLWKLKMAHDVCVAFFNPTPAPLSPGPQSQLNSEDVPNQPDYAIPVAAAPIPHQHAPASQVVLFQPAHQPARWPSTPTPELTRSALRNHPAQSREYRSYVQAVCAVASPSAPTQAAALGQALRDLAGSLDGRVHAWDAFIDKCQQGRWDPVELNKEACEELKQAAEKAWGDVVRAVAILTA